MKPLPRAIARAAAAATAALCLVVIALLPPAPTPLEPLSPTPRQPLVRGVYHVHTTRSDGTGTVEQVARAAARLGLQFVIVTDHGDATRRPDPPAYRSGVLVIDAVEISTEGGHYAALGLGQAPYPLAGEPRDVVEDVRRLGGFGIVAHPHSARPSLAWRDWGVEFDAIEWLNGDSQWRDASAWQLLRAGLTFPLRPIASLATLYRRPSAIDTWDGMNRHRRLVALAGTDAHARVGFDQMTEPYESRVLMRQPSYEDLFGVFSLRVRLEAPWTGRAAEDADSLLRAVRSGHVHTVVDALASPGQYEFTARSAGVSVGEGDRLLVRDAVVLRARANLPPGGLLVLFRDGREVHRVGSQELVYATNQRGLYRAEAWAPWGTMWRPWIVGNTIDAGPTTVDASPAAPEAASTAPRQEVGQGGGWQVEHQIRSSGTLVRLDDGVRLDYALDSAARRGPFAALVLAGRLPDRTGAIRFEGVADQPTRISVQVRVLARPAEERWRRSVYLDRTPRQVTVPLGDMAPVGSTRTPTPRLPDLNGLLFVVDTVNAAPGSSGTFTIRHVAFVGQSQQP